jgi:hypothetical protein
VAGLLLLGAGCSSLRILPGPNSVVDDPQYNPEGYLETIKSDRVIVGVLPRAGGRIVLCRLHEGQNVLLADPAQWAEPEAETPLPDAVAIPDKEYQGHVVWLGPQHRWWTEQDLNLKKKENASTWPADPWLHYGRYEVVEKSMGRIVLRGPDSPVSGVRLTKTVAILPDHRIEVSVTAENIRAVPVRWDLWSNTRLAGTCQGYATYCDKTWDALRLEFSGQPETTRMMPYCAANDVFSFAVDSVWRDRTYGYVAKAFLKPEGERLILAAFTPDTLFLKEAVATAEPVSPGHRAIEIFQQLTAEKSPGCDLLELEFHGPYRSLPPGEAMTFTETWTLLPWEGGTDPACQAEALREIRPADFGPR